jgi:chemotaxis protein CheX
VQQSDPGIGAVKMTADILLPARLDLSAASSLLADLQAALSKSERPLSVDAGKVGQIGGLCLQVILAAAAECRQNGRAFHLAPRSSAFDEAVARFGVPRAVFETEKPECP